MSSHWPGDELRVKLRRSGRQTEPAEQGAISLVGEDGSRLVDREPRELVDLLGRAEAPAAGSHRPVRDDLAALAGPDIAYYLRTAPACSAARSPPPLHGVRLRPLPLRVPICLSGRSSRRTPACERRRPRLHAHPGATRSPLRP